MHECILVCALTKLRGKLHAHSVDDVLDQWSRSHLIQVLWNRIISCVRLYVSKTACTAYCTCHGHYTMPNCNRLVMFSCKPSHHTPHTTEVTAELGNHCCYTWNQNTVTSLYRVHACVVFTPSIPALWIYAYMCRSPVNVACMHAVRRCSLCQGAYPDLMAL